MKTTTLNKIRSLGPREDVWKKLLTGLNKTQADDQPVTIHQIIEINSLRDALWCMRAFDFDKKQLVRFAYDCAKSVEYLLSDQRSKNLFPAIQAYLDNDVPVSVDVCTAYAAVDVAAHAVNRAAYAAADAVQAVEAVDAAFFTIYVAYAACAAAIYAGSTDDDVKKALINLCEGK